MASEAVVSSLPIQETRCILVNLSLTTINRHPVNNIIANDLVEMIIGDYYTYHASDIHVGLTDQKNITSYKLIHSEAIYTWINPLVVIFHYA